MKKRILPIFMMPLANTSFHVYRPHCEYLTIKIIKEMKKEIVSIFLMLLPMLASAQTFIRTLNNYSFAEIPKDLCLLNHKYFFPRDFFDSYQDRIKIYNEKFELVKEIDTNINLIFPKYNRYYKKEVKDPISGEWVIETESNTAQSAYLCYEFTNYNGQNYWGCPFSQTLFSDDETFEFYIPTDFETINTAYEINENARETYTFLKYKGVNVISETGEVLATFRANGFYFTSSPNFNRVDDIIYAIFSTSDENNPYALYKVDKSWSSMSNPSFSGKQGDVNKDGEVNVADHVKLSEIIMNQK